MWRTRGDTVSLIARIPLKKQDVMVSWFVIKPARAVILCCIQAGQSVFLRR